MATMDTGLQSRQTNILIGWSRRHVTQPETAANTVGYDCSWWRGWHSVATSRPEVWGDL